MLEYSRHVGDTHRKSFCQFFTHPDVAQFMTRWVLASGEKSIFDPAFGLGAFHEAVAKDPSIKFSACEIDPRVIEFWRRKTGKSSEFINTNDYLDSWGGKHSNIVCNPPYMRFQKFLNRNIISRKFQRHLGIRLSGYTNIASAFLLKSLSELRKLGRMAYIMPIEFLNTGYGSLVKEKLIASKNLYAILKFDCEKEIFPDATTSVGIILYDKAGFHTSVKFYSVKSVAELKEFNKIEPVSDISVEKLDPKSKWFPLFHRRSFEIDSALTVTLDSFGRFSRGIATGANEFFILRPSVAKEKGMNLESELIPCITKSSQIRKPVFEAKDYNKLYGSDSPVLLFSASSVHSKQAEKYIGFGKSKGFNNRFLTRSREPWYKTEKRNPSPLLLGVFSRGAYKIILNKSEALNLTCFHGFRPNLFGRKYIDHLFLYLLSKTGREIISLSVRKYGNSLDKFEPNDLNGSLVPSPDFFDSIPAEKVFEAVRQVKQREKLPKWTDDLFTQLKISDRTTEVQQKVRQTNATIQYAPSCRTSL